MRLTETLRFFLDGIGRSEEYEFYIRKFQSAEDGCFSVFCPDFDSVERAGELLKLNIHFLMGLDLYPALLLSGPRGPAMLEILQEDSSWILPLELSRESLRQTPEALGSLLKQGALQARREKKCPAIVARETLPRALNALDRGVSSRFLFIRMKGALRDRSLRPISLYRVLRDEPALAPEEYVLRQFALRLLENGMPGPIAISSPQEMLKEIFTIKGAGTILRPGSVIEYRTSPEKTDLASLRSLLRECFRRDLKDENFFSRVDHFYFEENYRGAVLLEELEQGIYLSKFAVGVQARGEGIAQELWERTIRDHPVLFWRSRPGNFINRWYRRIAQGVQEESDWVIFWRGAPIELLPEIIRYCRERPPDI